MNWVEAWRVQRTALVPVSVESELSVRYQLVWVIMKGGGCTVCDVDGITIAVMTGAAAVDEVSS